MVDGFRVHFESWGEAPPGILMLHGYLGSSSAWHRVLPILAPHTRAVAMDLPGAGYSDRPHNLTYDLPSLAEMIPRILDALGLERPILAGHSLGGSVALHAAARFPDRVSGLVLASPLAYRQLPPPGLRLARKYPGIARLFFSSPIGRMAIGPLVAKAAFAGEEARDAVRVQRLVDHLDAPGGWEAATKMGLAANESAPGAYELHAIRCPVLLFWGRHDRVHPLKCAHRMMADISGPTRLIELTRSAHNCHEEEWQRFGDETVAWLKD